jgi:hypothetical protein
MKGPYFWSTWCTVAMSSLSSLSPTATKPLSRMACAPTSEPKLSVRPNAHRSRCVATAWPWGFAFCPARHDNSIWTLAYQQSFILVCFLCSKS